MTNKYLITGGCGFIGSCVIRNLLNNKDNVVANIDKLSYSSNTQVLSDIKYQENYTFYQEDICNKDSINENDSVEEICQIIEKKSTLHYDFKKCKYFESNC